MNIIMKKLSDGYRYYPIIYKESKYVVEIKIIEPVFGTTDVRTTFGYIYEYNEKRGFLRKHKGKLIYKKKLEIVPLEKDLFLNMYELFSEDFLLYYPQIIRSLFRGYELYTNEKEEKQQKKKAVSFDGVVK